MNINSDEILLKIRSLVRNDQEAKYLEEVYNKADSAKRPYLIQPFNIMNTNYWVRPLYRSYYKSLDSQPITEADLEKAIVKAFVYIGTVNTMINMINIKLEEIETTGSSTKHGVGKNEIDDNLNYQFGFGNGQYRYFVELLANDGEIITISISVTGFINALITDINMPITDMQIKLNDQYLSFPQWSKEFKKSMIKKW